MGSSTTLATPAPALRTTSFASSRAGSPRIPSGGIDAVAARATESMRNNGERTDLLHPAPLAPPEADAVPDDGAAPVAFGGFASARGMKRSISNNENR